MSALLWLILTVAWAANPRHVLEPVDLPATGVSDRPAWGGEIPRELQRPLSFDTYSCGGGYLQLVSWNDYSEPARPSGYFPPGTEWARERGIDGFIV